MFCGDICVQEKDLLNKPVMVLDDDSDRMNRFRLTLFPPEDKAHRLISTLLKLEHTVWSLVRPETGVPRSVMSIGQLINLIHLSLMHVLELLTYRFDLVTIASTCNVHFFRC